MLAELRGSCDRQALVQSPRWPRHEFERLADLPLQAEWWNPHLIASEVVEEAVRSELFSLRPPWRRLALEVSEADRFMHFSRNF